MNRDAIKDLVAVFGVDPGKVRFILDHLVYPDEFIDQLFDCLRRVGYGKAHAEDVQNLVDDWLEIAELNSIPGFRESVWESYKALKDRDKREE